MLLYQKVARVLSDTWATRQVDFQFRTLTVTPMRLKLVGDAITRKKIAVYEKKPDSGGSRKAYYLDSDDDGEKGNSFYVCNFDLSDVWYSALVVHEAVHAANDIYAVCDVTHKIDEAAAYIAQALYLYTNSTKPAEVEKQLDQEKPNYWAFQIAKKLVEVALPGSRVETFFSGLEQPDPVQMLLAKVRRMYGEEANLYVAYDGVADVNASAEEDIDSGDFAFRRGFGF